MELQNSTEVNANNEKIHKEEKYYYCRKCLTPLMDNGTSDGFCKEENGTSFCKREFFAENRKLSEEVYRGAYFGE
jgi:hypothetical protein